MSEASSTPEPTPEPQLFEASSSRSQQTRPSLPPMRYPGDGFDFRRPIISSSPNIEDGDGDGDVIDLTNEPDSPLQHQHQQQRQTPNGTNPPPTRLPRFGRDIMADAVDVVDLEAENPSSSNRRGSASSDVEYVGSTTRPPNAAPLAPPTRSHLWDMLRRHTSFAGLSGEGGFMGGLGRPLPWAGRLLRRPPQEVESFWIGDSPGGGIDLTINVDVDYQPPGLASPRRPPADTYKPPSPPPEGFTRSAGEDEVVVCPNCNEELGTGDETKQQIWAVKNCGHVRITCILISSYSG